MKKYTTNIRTYLLFVIMLTAFTACKNTWSTEDKDMFYQSCMEDANTWAGSQDKAKTYCDCVMQKVQEKYPHEADALDHIDSVINDPDIRSCKAQVMGVRDTVAR